MQWAFDWQHWKEKAQGSGAFVQLFGRLFKEDGCQQSAAALTFTTLFAIVPMMTVSFAILSAMPALRERGELIQEWAFDYFVPTAGSQVIDYLNSFSQQASNLTGIGILFLVVTAVLMLRTIEQSLNRIWKINTPRKGVTSLMMYWAVLSLGPLSLGIGLAITSYVTSQAIFSETVSFLGGMRFWLSVLPLIFTTAMLTLLYTIVPNTSVPLKQSFIAALAAALLFELAKYGFTLFIRHAPSYQVVYGAFAAVPIFLMWIYISWLIVLGGALLVRVMVVFQQRRAQVPRLQAMMRLLRVFWERQQQGQLLRSNEVRRVLGDAGITHWDDFRNLLQQLGLIRRTDEGGYVLARDMRHLSLNQLMRMLPWPVATQLRARADEGSPWEQELQLRIDDARNALDERLDISLDELFSAQLKQRDSGVAP